MINIAVCDDNIIFLETVEKYISDYIESLHIEVKERGFSDSSFFVQAFHKENTMFDIVILDVEMPGINGFEVAKEIREKDKNTIIIFLTGNDKMVFESFKVNAFWYIRKRYFGSEIKECLSRAVKEVEDRYYIVKTTDGVAKIAVNQIVYIELVARKVEIHTVNKTYATNLRKIKDVEDKLESKAFIKIDRSCIVNMKYISSISKQNIEFDTGAKFVISRYRIKKVMESYQRYIRREKC